MRTEQKYENIEKLIGNDETTNTIADIAVTGGRLATAIGLSRIVKRACNTMKISYVNDPISKITIPVATYFIAAEAYDKGAKIFDRQIEDLAKLILDVKEGLGLDK